MSCRGGFETPEVIVNEVQPKITPARPSGLSP